MATPRLAIILGDQLDIEYPDALRLDKTNDIILMVEIADASVKPHSHIQRTVLFLSAMRHHAQRLRDAGWNVDYVSLTEPKNTNSFDGELARAIKRHKPNSVTCVEPGSFDVLDQIESACDPASLELDIIEDPHFLCDHQTFGEWATGRKELVMEYFYREQRKRLGILLTEDGKPEGGDWNFDKENRKPFKKSPDAPPVIQFKPDSITKQVIKDVQQHLPDLPGKIKNFNWPINRDQALQALDDFVDHRIKFFGDHQDAMWTAQHTLYHSLLSSSLNLKLLNPREVYQAAVAAYESGNAPINAVEGFIRQIIGWREYIRGIYFHQGPGYDQRNALEHEGNLPEFYWTADTDMNCMAEALSNVVNNAYGHHIERLMITGNFALIAGIHPTRVHEWYLGMYTDAIDWVTAPNTVGMALHADGGVVATKPYAASSNYINKMSNYCKHCRYDRTKRSGEDACPFNTFYWDFLIRHEQRFNQNHRMRMMLKHVEKMSKTERVEITTSAASIRDRFGING
ncbi:MAG: cryptochrome/photolyase family protein [Phycisphaerales bacterium]